MAPCHGARTETPAPRTGAKLYAVGVDERPLLRRPGDLVRRSDALEQLGGRAVESLRLAGGAEGIRDLVHLPDPAPGLPRRGSGGRLGVALQPRLAERPLGREVRRDAVCPRRLDDGEEKCPRALRPGGEAHLQRRRRVGLVTEQPYLERRRFEDGRDPARSRARKAEPRRARSARRRPDHAAVHVLGSGRSNELRDRASRGRRDRVGVDVETCEAGADDRRGDVERRVWRTDREDGIRPLDQLVNGNALEPRSLRPGGRRVAAACRDPENGCPVGRRCDRRSHLTGVQHAERPHRLVPRSHRAQSMALGRSAPARGSARARRRYEGRGQSVPVGSAPTARASGVGRLSGSRGRVRAASGDEHARRLRHPSVAEQSMIDALDRATGATVKAITKA